MCDQVDPVFYLESCLNLLGRALNHDDSDSDRAPGTKLSTCGQVNDKISPPEVKVLLHKRGLSIIAMLLIDKSMCR